MQDANLQRELATFLPEQYQLETLPRGYKTFFMLDSVEHDI